jgi:glycerophosphoryl diester phosphodiesterase
MFFDLLPRGGYVCAHRGARGVAPENTLLAARLAVEAGADFWELDARFTSDGALVVFHDDTLERTTDVANRPEFAGRAPWPVCGFTLAELQTLDAGSWFAARDPHGAIGAGEVGLDLLAEGVGQRIPTLGEALTFSRMHGLPVNVEIKDQLHQPGETAIADAVLEEIAHTGTREMVLVSSFNHGYLRRLRELDPGLPLAALVEERHAGQGGRQSSSDREAEGEEVLAESVVAYLHALGARGYHPDHELLDAPLVRSLAARGVRVTPYTVNDMDRAAMLLASGCFAITTDHPGRLRRRLEEPGT